MAVEGQFLRFFGVAPALQFDLAVGNRAILGVGEPNLAMQSLAFLGYDRFPEFLHVFGELLLPLLIVFQQTFVSGEQKAADGGGLLFDGCLDQRSHVLLRHHLHYAARDLPEFAHGLVRYDSHAQQNEQETPKADPQFDF